MARNNSTTTGPLVPRVQEPGNGSTSLHPRRPPAHTSVSIPHPEFDPNALKPSEEEEASNPSSLVAHRDSSGETSNAENWFDRSNKNTSGNKPPLDDSSSPFNFENDESPTQHQRHDQGLLSVRHPLIRGNSTGSSSEEYRSVIDDLTIENKRLKKRLKKYERSQDSPMQKDKLFEVRVHGLPPDKKRELEETLRKFASSMTQSLVSGKTYSDAISAQSRLGNMAAKRDSSLSSLAIPADSGYGSMTATGKPSSTPHSVAASGLQSTQQNQANAAQSRDKNIRSYLHDIPEGLMPHHPLVMTEKSRKKIVVRRLEQIFGGKVADPDFGQQPLQQQEVSKTAAHDEKSAMEASGRKVNAEGHREAPIMDTETEDPMDLGASPTHDHSKPAKEATKSTEGPSKEFGASQSSNSDTSSSSTMAPAEQRPTRPLDLDPHRAQDPVENIEYIRHLGFLNNEPSESSRPILDGQNWIYLNLLVNMAQLHTINVTTDFVKDAITEHSNKLELSNDGRKVRWRDVGSPNKESSNSPIPETDSDRSPGMQGENAGDKRARPAYLETFNDSGRQAKKQTVAVQSKDKFAYRPIIPSNKVSSDSDESDDASMADAQRSPSEFEDAAVKGGASGFASTSKRHPSLPARRDNGPIIFYNNATFCTDLSGDMTLLQRVNTPIESQPITGSPLGATQAKGVSAKGSRRGSAKVSTKGSIIGSTKGSGGASERGVFDVSDLASSIHSLSPMSAPLKFPSNDISAKQVTFLEPEEPMPLEASGIGGVTPHDNIAITVQRRYTATAARKGASAAVNPKLSAVLPSSQQPKDVPTKEHVIATHEKNLDPSPLPPASLHFDAEDAKSDSDFSEVETSSGEDDEDDMADTETAEPMVPVTLGARTNLSSSGSGCSSSEDRESDESDEDNAESQIDFLATARAADPEAIRAREREYDAEMAERLAEDIPAGSSAATAGGGSGFNSPEVLMAQRLAKNKRGGSVSS